MFKGIKARFGILAVIIALLLGTFGSIAVLHAQENELPSSATHNIVQFNNEDQGPNNQSAVSDNQTGNNEDQGPNNQSEVNDNQTGNNEDQGQNNQSEVNDNQTGNNEDQGQNNQSEVNDNQTGNNEDQGQVLGERQIKDLAGIIDQIKLLLSHLELLFKSTQ
jgi:hypothetical protein